MTEPERRTLVERLSTLLSGPEASGLALDATLTPDSLAPARRGASESVGPLPRIALSGEGAPARDDAPPAAADLEILSVLGEGGMGRVHLARQRSLGREVAVKTLKEGLADERTVAMLRAEATTMGRLEHPNIVPVHAVGMDDGGRLVLVMKRIDGVSWRELLRDPSHPRWQTFSAGDPLETHLDVLEEVARALEFAHAQGIVHRDVKPENVLLGAHGEVYLADWGVALRLSDAARGGTELVGTPAYMAPEMVVGDRAKIDARTDVFLLGATLHEVLTGAPPHDGANVHETLLQAFEASPPRYGPEVPSELAAIATRAMAPRPEDRFAAASDFRRAIAAMRRHRGSIALVRAAKELLEKTTGESGAADPGLDRTLTECRFALVSALRDWPENEEARRTLDACVRRMIEHELARENAGAAESLLRELSAPDDTLAARVAEVGTKVEARRREAERLQAMVADQDLNVGLGTRVWAIALLVLASLGITALVIAREEADPSRAGVLDAADPVRFGVFVLALVVLPLVLFRRRLLANAIGRRVSAVLVLVTATLLGHRVVALALGLSATATLTLDLTILAGFTTAAGVLVPRTAFAGLAPAIAAVLCVVFPDRVPILFSVGTLLNLVLVGALWMSAVRAETRS